MSAARYRESCGTHLGARLHQKPVRKAVETTGARLHGLWTAPDHSGATAAPTCAFAVAATRDERPTA